MNDKQQLAAMGKEILQHIRSEADKDKHPATMRVYQSDIPALMGVNVGKPTMSISDLVNGRTQPLCMANRIEELEAQVRVMADLLKKSRMVISESIPFFSKRADCYKVGEIAALPSSIDSALSGNIPTPAAPQDWKLIGYRNHSAPNGLRRFMTPKQYSRQTDGIKKWYEPVYAAPVPEGWQLVPVNPTPEMEEQGGIAYWSGETNSESILKVWNAMLGATPKLEGGA